MGRKRAADEAADASQHAEHTQNQPSAGLQLQQGNTQVPQRGLARGDQGLGNGSAAKPPATGAAAEPKETRTTRTAPQPVMKKM
jgi:hypothetical protein